MNYHRLNHDVRLLSLAYPTAIDDDCKSITVNRFNLPPGYNYATIPVLLEIPSDYPEKPPGIGDARVYVPSDLRYHGRTPEDFHPSSGPTPDWAWWCYERIHWDPSKDDLITFFELLRAHMTNPN